MIEIFIGLLAPVIIFGLMISMYVRRGLQMRELCEHGKEATGKIFSKRSITGNKSRTRRWKLGYSYTDSAGVAHEHTSLVMIDFYQQHEEGGPISIIYSTKNPAVSSPKYLVDEARKVLPK